MPDQENRLYRPENATPLFPSESAKSSKSDQVTQSQSPPTSSESTPTPRNPSSPSTTTATEPSSSNPSPSPDQSPHVRDIPLSAIDVADPGNGRLCVDPDNARDLARQMAASGLINPIVVRPVGARYELIAGNTRFAAAHILGWTVIAASIRTSTDLQASTIRLAENVKRSNLTPVEEATQLNTLVEANPQGVDGVASALNVKTDWILDRLDLLMYPDSLLGHVHNKTISLAAAKRLARIQPPELQEVRIEQAAYYKIDAKTASLWLQDALATVRPDFELPEISTQIPQSEISVTTKIRCFACKENHEIQNTTPTRLCAACLTQLAEVTKDEVPSDKRLQQPYTQTNET